MNKLFFDAKTSTSIWLVGKPAPHWDKKCHKSVQLCLMCKNSIFPHVPVTKDKSCKFVFGYNEYVRG